MERKNLKYLLIPSSNYADQASLDNEAVSTFYTENTNSFMTEEEIDDLPVGPAAGLMEAGASQSLDSSATEE
mgnify:CR=1 FL=1